MQFLLKKKNSTTNCLNYLVKKAQMGQSWSVKLSLCIVGQIQTTWDKTMQ